MLLSWHSLVHHLLWEALPNLWSGLHSPRKHVNPCEVDEGGHLRILLGGSLMLGEVRCGCIPDYPPQGATTITSRRHTNSHHTGKGDLSPGHSDSQTVQPLSHSQHSLQRSFSHSPKTYLRYCLPLWGQHLCWVALFWRKDECIYSP